jgi:20S proteasome alpha/beta subunit
MEVLLGITGKDFTIVAASKAAMRGATILKASDDKTRELNKYNLMAFSGEAGDTGMCFHDCSQLCLKQNLFEANPICSTIC